MPANGVDDAAFGVAPGRIGADVAVTAGDFVKTSFETDDDGRIGVVDGGRMLVAGVAVFAGAAFVEDGLADDCFGGRMARLGGGIGVCFTAAGLSA